MSSYTLEPPHQNADLIRITTLEKDGTTLNYLSQIANHSIMVYDVEDWSRTPLFLVR